MGSGGIWWDLILLEAYLQLGQRVVHLTRVREQLAPAVAKIGHLIWKVGMVSGYGKQGWKVGMESRYKP